MSKSDRTPTPDPDPGLIQTLDVIGNQLGEFLGRRDAEQSAQSVVDTAHEAFVAMDSNGVITGWNPTAEETFGWSAQEAIGSQVSEKLVPEEYREAYQQALSHFLSTGEGPMLDKRLEMTAVRRDGSTFPVEMTITAVERRDGWRFHSFLHDITDRKQADEARERAGRHRELQLAVAGVLAEAVTPEDAMPRVLAALGGGAGWPVGAFWGHGDVGAAIRCQAFWSDPDVMVGDMEERTREQVLAPGEGLPGEAMSGGRVVWASDRVAIPLRHGGETVGALEFLGTVAQVPDEDLAQTLTVIGGQVAQFLARKQAEQEADRMKEEFFSLVSHELRTPLTSVIGYTDMLDKTEAEHLSDRGRKFIEIIRRNANREMRLVGDLLMLVRIEAGEFELEPGLVDLHKVAQDSVEAMRPVAEKAELSLSLDLEEVPQIPGDAERIAQALDNLLSNAIKFSPSDGKVEVHVGRDEHSVAIEVRDTGPGIAPEDRDRLFDRLFRAPSASRDYVQGAGLGLTIVKAIIEAHGGAVRVESELGSGATFRIELPLAVMAPTNGAGPVVEETGAVAS